FSYSGYGPVPLLHSFPTRRSSDLVEFCIQDYRDISGKFDGIASIEMFEAVGERYWPAYFRALREALKPGARACIQTITIANDRRSEEHTSELQSPCNLVCRLLLEK